MVARASAAASPSATPAVTSGAVVSDSTGLLAWAGLVGDVRRLIARVETASVSEAPALADTAFAEARRLAAAPLSEGNAAVRTLLLDAQALYEQYHGPVATTVLSGEELARLRGPALAALPAGGLVLVAVEETTETTAGAAAALAASPLPATLVYPEHAENTVAREEARLLRVYGGVRGITSRTRRHFPMIEQALAARGLPEELKYVAFIESGMDAGAVSPAGAVGLWQMLPATGAMYGLDSLALYHPTRATRAATRHLAYLGRLFDGDWQLALAAYNCGQGRVQGLVRQMTRQLGRPPTFWDLYPHLPAETRTYVPRFIALARALEEPA